MYTLHKAKEEIDAVANHATDIATHVLTLSDDLHAELSRFKKDILDGIDKKFADLERTIQGDAAISDSSAVADLGAKVSLLSSSKHPAGPQGSGSDPEARPAVEAHEHEPAQHTDGAREPEERLSQGGYDPNAEPRSEGHRY